MRVRRASSISNMGKLEETVLVEDQNPMTASRFGALTTISLLIHGADRDGAPASVTKTSPN
jgi:hypothetical protein